MIDYDVTVKTRSGYKIYVDVYRPDQDGKYPVIINWSPYGKHSRGLYSNRPSCGVDEEDLSEYVGFEAEDPCYWIPNGYIIIRADPRGAWGSEGDLTFMTSQEAEDCYDLIEWAALQPWSNGKVGMSGVSYLAWIQWKVAALNPPHLAAINPWEGATDFYREFAFHGGVPTTFLPRWAELSFGRSFGKVEDVAEMAKRHPLLDEYWQSKNADLSRIVVPAFVVASWSDQGLHTRGTIEGFCKISSKDKWLLIHGRRKWQTYYDKEFVEKRRMFFDRFLKGIDNDVKNWPRIIYEVRYRFYAGRWKTSTGWPIPQTKYIPLYLDAKNKELREQNPREMSQACYDTDKNENLVFDYTFQRKTEITGYMKLKLWVTTEHSDDMDLFVGIQKVDRSGQPVYFPIATFGEDGLAALGWLRASHRELDADSSTFYRPVYRHQRLLKLMPGEIVPVEIEIWPSSTMFYAGEKLRLVIQGSDIYKCPYGLFAHGALANKGKHVVYSGGKYDSHLLVPFIPSIQ
ncbi:MAG: CocE/NonD family hydrolase [Candidatus Caldarchaeum sp.]